MKNFFTILMILVSSFIPFIVFAQANFVRDLFVGISGPDVLDLQKILNSDSETKIAETGVGSPGAETDYFGNLTKLAVEKFQLKYSDYVLKPIGLALPTGRVGQYTRDFLNNKFSELKESAQKIIPAKTEEVKKVVETEKKQESNKQTTTSFDSTKTNDFLKSYQSNTGSLLKDFIVNDDRKIQLYSASQIEFAPKTQITFNGLGFTENNNTFYFNNFKISNISCESYQKCSFIIPPKMPLGEKDVVVENADGSSAHQSFKVRINITENPVSPPGILKVFPEEISYKNLNTKFTITGYGFSDKNYVAVFADSIGPIKSVLNNNKKTQSLQFNIKKNETLNELITSLRAEKAKAFDLSILVYNEYGYSNNVVIKINLEN
jgi:peptidoglycan hydrolase-like protein with peptidoglycan-binding domain